MSNTGTGPSPRAKPSAWVTLGVVAVVAIAAGVLVPQLLPGETAVEKSQPKSEAKAKTKTEFLTPTISEMPSPQNMLLRLAAGTVVVLGLSVGSIWAMRRWLQPQGNVHAGPRTLHLLETLPLGNRCVLHLVRLGTREVLVGIDAGGVKSIVPLTPPFEDVLAQTNTNDTNRDGVAL
jgi:flagellar biogenesis protein FliO